MDDAAIFGNGDYKCVSKRTIQPDGVDKVMGRTAYGADYNMPGLLYGKVLRSPHAHARIVKIDTTKAEALSGVKAVITAADWPEIPPRGATKGTAPVNFRHLSDNLMARRNVISDGHAVAAVAATSAQVAKRAAKLIDVEYEVLPHVIVPVEAAVDGAPLLLEDLFTNGLEQKPSTPCHL